jgi:hypothetical protein
LDGKRRPTFFVGPDNLPPLKSGVEPMALLKLSDVAVWLEDGT